MIIAVLLAAFAVWSSFGHRDRTDPVPPTPPAPVSEVERAAAGFIADYRAGLADAYDSVANDLASGVIQTEEQAADELDARCKEARLMTNKPLRQLFQDGRGDEFNPETYGKMLRDAAKGFRK